MNVGIKPSPLEGTLMAIPSKSYAHRMLILSALANDETRIRLSCSSEDIEATISCLSAIGAHIEKKEDMIFVTPVSKPVLSPVLNCKESGSTLRFLLPVVSALFDSAGFEGGGRLPERPLSDLAGEMKRHGVEFSREKLPFKISGRLRSGEYVLPGNVSSQYITGLLLALPQCSDLSRLSLSSKLESSPYVDMTLSALRRFGVKVIVSDRTYEIPGNQKFISPGYIKAEGDWSNAAFFLASGAIGGNVTVKGLDIESCQGDKAIVDYLARFGAVTKVSGDEVTVINAPLKGCHIDISDTPDLLPVLSVTAAFAEGETRFSGGTRLRLKESDRINSTVAMVRALGGVADETGDGITVHGMRLSGGTVDSFRDHRIVMAAAVAASHCPGPVKIIGADAAAKSYPAFFEDYTMMGGNVHVI